jgi:hypothetical protein
LMLPTRILNQLPGGRQSAILETEFLSRYQSYRGILQTYADAVCSYALEMLRVLEADLK